MSEEVAVTSNAPYIMGLNHHVVRYRNIRMWHEKGQICLEDARTNEFAVLSIRDVLLRLRAINDSIKHFDPSWEAYDVRREQMKFVGAVIELVKMAKAHGTPDDPQAAEYHYNNRPKSIIMPSSFDFEPPADAPAKKLILD